MDDKNIQNQNKEEKKPVDQPPEAKVTEGELTYDKDIFKRSDDVTEGVNFAPDEEELSSEDLMLSDSQLSFYDLDTKENKDKEKVKKKKKYKVIREKGGAVRSIAFTVAYISAVLVAGVILGYFIIVFMNDVFAFAKDDTVVNVTVKDSNITVDQLADMLHEEGLIEYPFLVRLYVVMKYDGEVTVKEGSFELSPSFNYDKLITALNPAPPRTTVSITFPEGITTDEIIETFLEYGIGTREGFEKVIAEGDFEYWFLEDLETKEERYYRLDGYLYPDTYLFYSDSTEEQALKKLLSNFNKKFSQQYMTRIEELGLTVDQVVTLASMIEAEAFKTSDFEFVSAVFHNRLNSADFNGKFESDATIQYVLAHEYGGRHEELTAEDLLIDSPYNTRVYEGYPPGPICSPSLNALKAAIYPDEDCGYFYFVADSEGNCLYAKTYQEHLKNIETVKSEEDE